jgi:hypothetical protein
MLCAIISKRLRVVSVWLSMTILLLGCSFSFGEPKIAVEDAVATAVQATMIAQQIQTIEAFQTAQAEQDPDQQASQGQQGDQQADSGETSTPSITLEPTATFTPTSSVPLVSVSVDTNCRFGPGKDFELVGALLVGEQADIIGRDPSSTYWYIKNPDNVGFCWLWGYYATTNGEIASLPVFTPMPTLTPTPTPTPVIDFNVSFREDDDCSGNYYIEFRLENTGNIIYQSVWVSVTNNDDVETVDTSYDKFEEWDACAINQTYSDLDPGDVGYTRSADLTNDPNGKSFSATVKICSEPAAAGTCIEKKLNFTP